jgi:hypothetical protein
LPVTRSRATSAVAPFDQLTWIVTGACMSLTPVITKCHSVLSHSWSLRALAEMVMDPPVVPVVPVVVDVPVEVDVLVLVPVVAVPVVLVLVFVPVVFVPVVAVPVVLVPVLPVVLVPVVPVVLMPVLPVVFEPPVVEPCSSHSTQKTLCFSPPGACGVVWSQNSL